MEYRNQPGLMTFANASLGLLQPAKTSFVGAQSFAPAPEGRTLQPVAALCVSALSALLLALFLIVPMAPAYADNTQLDSPVTVSDDVTRVQVNKLDTTTHAYVEGATMAIINESTNEVVDSWITGSTTHECTKTLNVGTVYILRELAAPSGYSKVSDVRFVVNETEGEGITILSGGDDSELTGSYVVSLYDTAVPTENVETVTKTTTSTIVAPKTGDETPLTLVAALMAVGVSAILILQVLKRRMDA